MISMEVGIALEKGIGLPLSRVYELSINDEISFVEEKIGKCLSFSKNSDYRKRGRGNVLLMQGKFTTIEEINAKIDAL